jgi:hypothetical protein
VLKDSGLLALSVQVDWASQYFRSGQWGAKALAPEDGTDRPDGLLDVRVWALQPHVQVVPASCGPLSHPAAAAAQALAAAAEACPAGSEGKLAPASAASPCWLILEAGDGVFYRLSVGPAGWRQRMLPSLSGSALDDAARSTADQHPRLSAGAATAVAAAVAVAIATAAACSCRPTKNRAERKTQSPATRSATGTKKFWFPAWRRWRWTGSSRGGRGIRGAAGTGRGVATVTPVAPLPIPQKESQLLNSRAHAPHEPPPSRPLLHLPPPTPL